MNTQPNFDKRVLTRLMRLHVGSGVVSNRLYWHGPTDITYRSTMVGNIWVVTGSDGSTYAEYME